MKALDTYAREGWEFVVDIKLDPEKGRTNYLAFAFTKEQNYELCGNGESFDKMVEDINACEQEILNLRKK